MLIAPEAPAAEVISIEGNSYFPPASLADGVLAESATPYTCPWKGPAQYWDLHAGQDTVADGAWSYPVLKSSAVERVGRDRGEGIAGVDHRRALLQVEVADGDGIGIAERRRQHTADRPLPNPGNQRQPRCRLGRWERCRLEQLRWVAGDRAQRFSAAGFDAQVVVPPRRLAEQSRG
ncbi:MAG: DUF427 domain-containing protein [Actinomycetota bacterium]